MSEPASLAILGNLTKPASDLIEKIADLVGGYLKPFQMVRIAKGENKVERIRAVGKLELQTELEERAFRRVIVEESVKQENIESITAKTVLLLGDGATPKKIDDDWLRQFLDHSKAVSDKDMQFLYARVLAGEASFPGAIARRTLNLIADLDKSDANLFTNLCGFCWHIGDYFPLVFDWTASIYIDAGVNFDSLNDLVGLGLIQFSPVNAFSKNMHIESANISYFDRPLQLVGLKGKELRTGNVLFTRAGRQLFPYCGAKKVKGCFDYVRQRLDNDGVIHHRKSRK